MTARFDLIYADLVGAGYRGHLEPVDAVRGIRCATVLDPNENGVDVFAILASGTPAADLS